MRRVAILGALIVVLAGCGGDPSSLEDNRLSAAEWQREANAICRDIAPQVRAVRIPRSEAEITAFTSAVIPLWKEEEERLRALRPPAELVTRAEELADALSEVNVSLLEIHIATQRDDGLRRYFAVQRSDTAARGVKLRSRALGLPACARQRVP